MDIKLIILEADDTIFQINDVLKRSNEDNLLKNLAKKPSQELIADKTLAFLQSLQGKHQLYLTSKEDERFVFLLLHATHTFSLFNRVYAKGSVKHHKPNPEVYLRAALRAEVCPNQCLIIDDSLIGQDAARAACIPILSLAAAMRELA